MILKNNVRRKVIKAALSGCNGDLDQRNENFGSSRCSEWKFKIIFSKILTLAFASHDVTPFER